MKRLHSADSPQIMRETKEAFQLRLDEEAHSKVKAVAEKEFQSLNAQIEYFVYRGIGEYEREHGAIHI